jgi:hypothetical protein
MAPIFALITLAATTLFAQEYEGDYEERPSLGLYMDFTSISNVEFSYQEIPNPGQAKTGSLDSGDSTVASYDLAKGIEVSPLIGIAGHLPFLWNNYFNATMVVGFQHHAYHLTSADSRTIDAGTNEKTMESYSVVIQGGPELGLPLYTDFKSQQMFKIFAYGQVIIGKTFLDGESNFQNDPYWGYNYGFGVRYAIKRFSLSAGTKTAEWIWKPVYQEDVGNIDPDLGEDLVNKMRVRYTQFYNIYFDIKYSLF